MISGPGEHAVLKSSGEYTLHTTLVVYDVAAAICKVTGAHLAAIESQQEQLQIESFTEREKVYWLDGRYASQTKTFFWLHSNIKLSETFLKWSGGTPPNMTAHPKHQCLCLYQLHWHVNPCSYHRYFICEY